LRRRRHQDADAILARHAGDVEATRRLVWPRHESADTSRGLVDFSDADWQRWPAGPYLVESRESGARLGATGLGFDTAYRATAGDVFANDAWGRGHATEAIGAMVGVAREAGVVRLYAPWHVDHPASAGVMETCGFARQGGLRRYAEFPNLGTAGPCDVPCYAPIL
jgi:ribosomal-protein-alanine N-acetyltransferase